MQKIISLFQRNYDTDRKVRDEVTPGAEWVILGEGMATRKWDGVAVLIKGGKPFMRFDAKKGRKIPEDFEPVQPAPDPITGHWPGWVSAECSAGKWILEAIRNYQGELIEGQTYEAVGPKIGTRHGANPEQFERHELIRHAVDVIENCPRTYVGIMEFLKDKKMEGIVFWHADGRLAKIKRHDFPY